MQLKKLQKISSISTFVSCILFLILITIGMFTYAGGSEHYPDAEGYNYAENFFSDLGRARVFDDAPNFTSRTLFVLALSLVGISVAVYSIAVIPLFSDSIVKKTLSILGSISGIVSAIGLIMLGIISLDIHEYAHGTFTVIAFMATALALILYSIIIFMTKDFPNVYSWIITICTAASIMYIVILIGWEYIDLFSDWIIQTVSQKIIVYIQIITLAILAFGTLEFVNKRSSVTVD